MRDPTVDNGIPLEEAARNHDPALLLRALDRHGVDYVLIGGLASIVHGSQRPTQDVDITPDRSERNLVRLAAALGGLGAQLRVEGLDHGFPTDLDAQALARMTSMTLVTDHGFLDLAFMPDGTAGYEDIAQNAQTRNLFGVDVLICALPDILRSKRAAGRQKDLDAVGELEQLLSNRD